MGRNKVVCDIPRAGLGNQLFPLLKSYFFARNNQLPILVSGYHQFKVGPYLRGDRSKRKYKNFFVFEENIAIAYIKKLRWKSSSDRKIYNPSIDLLVDKSVEGGTYIFNEIPEWNNYFKEIREKRKDIIRLLWQIIKTSVKSELNMLKEPCIGLHMRMGDFKKLAEGIDFNKVGVTRTPEDYFHQIIVDIRHLHGSDLPVSIFTDGHPGEIGKILSLKNISVIAGNNDLVDLLLLSRSKIIITSAGSTFSYWAGFLSDAPIIMHPAHIYEPIRLPEEGLYEGPLNMHSSELVGAITGIKCTG